MGRKDVPKIGKMHIRATFTNTIITITNPSGDTLFWDSCGSNDFKRAKKRTAYAANRTSNQIGKLAFRYGLRKLSVVVYGVGRGRVPTIRGLKHTRLRIM